MGPLKDSALTESFHTGQHLCWFYETEDEYRNGLTHFIEQGIEKNEKILFITNRSQGDGSKDFELELISLLSISPNSKQFIDSTSWNEFTPCQNPEAAIFQIRSMIAQSLEEGYSGLWVTAGLSRLGRPGQSLDRWVEFESLLNGLIREHPLLVLCQYPTRSFRPDQLQNFLEVHPEILLGGRVHENIYYLPPEVFSNPDRAQAGFQNRLRNIQAAAKNIERSDGAGVRFDEPANDHRRKLDPSRLQYQALPLAAPASIWEEDLPEMRASEARLVEARQLLQIDGAEKERIALALKQSEKKYRRLAEQMVDGVILTDEIGRVAEWNQGAEQIFGICKRDVLGKFLWDVQSQVTEHVGQRQLIYDRQKIIIQSVLENGHSLKDDHPYYVRIRRPDGVHRIVQSLIYTIDSEKGNIISGIFRDVTEEEKAKEALLESRERYRILSELTSDCAYCLGVRSDGTPFLEWVTAPEIMGWKTEELRQGKGFMEIVYPADLADYREHTARWLNGRESVREFRVVSKTGEVCWIRDSRRPVWSKEAERVIRVYGAITDITERKLSEQSISESEERFRILFNTMANGVLYRDAGGKIISANPAALRILGRSLEDLLIHNYFDEQHPLIGENGAEFPYEEHPAIQSLRSGKERRGKIFGVYNPVEERYRWVLANAMPLYRPGEQKPFQVYTTFEDVTAIKEANLALQESENRFRTLIEEAPLPVCISRNGFSIYGNARYLEMFGYESLDEVQGTPVLDRIAPQCREAIADRLNQRKLGAHIGEFIETYGLRKDGSQFPYRAAVTNVRLPDGPAILIFFLDITEQKQAEESLQKANQVLQAIITASPLAVIGVDLTRTITLWTPSAEKLFGWKAKEILGKRLSPSDHQLKGVVDEIFADTIQGKSFSNYEICSPTNYGTSLNVSVSTSPLLGPDDEVNGVMAIVMDIEQRKIAEARLEKSLIQLHALSARLQSIREEERTRISREIHDELGQELTSLKMDLFWIKNRLEKNFSPASGAGPASPQPLIDKMTDMLALIGTTISTVQRIATELRPSILDTLGLIPAMEWLAKDFNNRCGIDCKFQCDLNDLSLKPEVSTAIFRICQEALTNVARHAKASNVFILMQRRGDHLELTVTDNGTGIDLDRTDDVNSLGLLGMKERAFIIGGDVHFEVVSTGGTRVITTIPLTKVV